MFYYTNTCVPAEAGLDISPSDPSSSRLVFIASKLALDNGSDFICVDDHDQCD